MLSNPSSSLQQRQRQHRRQNSTPNALQAPKVPLLPVTPLQRNGSKSKSHRRGQSLDLRPSQSTPRLTTSNNITPSQDDISVSINPGFQPSPNRLQHALREAQQQRLGRPDQLPQRPFKHPPLGEGVEGTSPDLFEACLSATKDGLGNLAPSLHNQPDHFRKVLVGSQSSGRLGLGQSRSTYDPFEFSSFTSDEPDAIAAYLNGCGFGLDENQAPHAPTQGGNTGCSGLKRAQSHTVPNSKRWSRGQGPSTPPQHAMLGKSSASTD